MKLGHAQVLLAAFVLGLGVQVASTWPQRVEVAAADRYGRELRAVLALELALTAELMRAQSGLVGHFDGLVDLTRLLKLQLAALRDPPGFLRAAERAELAQAIATAERARKRTVEIVERFKSEHAVLRNSLRFLPVASRALDAYVPTTPEQHRFKEDASALVRDVLLLQAVNDQPQIDRVGARLASLSQLHPDVSAAVGEELALVLLHARIAHERAPRIVELVRQVVRRPEVAQADDNVSRYERFVGLARARAARNAEVSFALLLLSVLTGALAIILRLRLSAEALRQTTGELEGAIASLRVEQEKQRELAEIKGRFISMTSHEFRTPLSTIMSSSELLEAYADRWPADKKQEHFARVRGAVRNLIRMLDGVLMVGRSDAGKLEFKPAKVQLRRLCEEVVQTAAESCRADHEIVLESADVDGPVIADEMLLRHVIDNLLSNAVKYSPAGSRVSLRVHREGDDVIIEVSDRGIGIPAADQKRLFETFERGSNVGAVPGTGLGLAIAKRALDLHGGTLSVTSEVGEGTVFTVRLPCPRRAA